VGDRAVIAGDTGELGWKCTWAESPCSLWAHNLRDGMAANEEKMHFVSGSNGLFLTPVACPELLSCPAHLRGRWLDIQMMALLSVWKPNDFFNTGTLFSSPSDELVSKVVQLLHIEPNVHWTGEGQEREAMSVRDGNLLAFLAISSRPLEELLSPVPFLIEGGAVLNSPKILAASRKAANLNNAASDRWNELMRVVALRNLIKKYSAFQKFLQLRQRPNYRFHVLQNNGDSYPEQFRPLTYMDPIQDLPVVDGLEQAVVVATAVGLDCAELEGALKTLATNPDCVRRIFFDAICQECDFAKESCTPPNMNWLRSCSRFANPHQPILKQPL